MLLLAQSFVCEYPPSTRQYDNKGIQTDWVWSKDGKRRTCKEVNANKGAQSGCDEVAREAWVGGRPSGTTTTVDGMDRAVKADW